MVRVMKESMFPSFPMLTVSSGFAVMPGGISVIEFIENDGDAGLCAFL